MVLVTLQEQPRHSNDRTDWLLVCQLYWILVISIVLILAMDHYSAPQLLVSCEVQLGASSEQIFSTQSSYVMVQGTAHN